MRIETDVLAVGKNRLDFEIVWRLVLSMGRKFYGWGGSSMVGEESRFGIFIGKFKLLFRIFRFDKILKIFEVKIKIRISLTFLVFYSFFSYPKELKMVQARESYYSFLKKSY